MALVSYEVWEVDRNYRRAFIGCYRTLEGAQKAAKACDWAARIEKVERYPDLQRLAAESDARWGMH